MERMIASRPDPDVYEIEAFGEATRAGTDLLIEVPHGATDLREYEALRRRLVSPLPESLLEFFLVNTDFGAPECARHIARALVESSSDSWRRVTILRSQIPRTFADCNRELDASREELAAGGFTSAVPEYVTADADRTLLARLHAAYGAEADRLHAQVRQAGGTALLLHTYAPRSVEVEVDADVVEALRRAYSEDVYGSWALRPDFEAITETPAGERLAPAGLVRDLLAAYERAGFTAAENATYRLHRGTTAYRHSIRYPGGVVCVELNRQRLGDPWRPFEESRCGDGKIEAMTAPLVATLLAWGR